jgi:hypothetical protein
MKNERIFPFQKFQVVFCEIDIDGRDWFIMRARGENAVKYAVNYRFRTEAQRDEYYAKWAGDLERKAADRVARAAKKKEVRANMVNPFKVGDIFYDSWGYEQTNIDFYQVVEAGPKSVVIREVAQSGQNERGYSPMSEMVSARPNEFIGEPVKKPLQILGNGDIYISSRHGWMGRWDGRPKYASHYA